MTTYKKLENQPLKFAIAEFRFSPIMNIGEYIPKFQDLLRKKYPFTNKKIEQVVHMLPSGPEKMVMNNWLFLSANKRCAIQVNQERVIYFTSEYPRFKGFSDEVEFMLGFLSQVMEPGLITRIGLRYSDLITLSGDEKMDELVDSSFLYPNILPVFGEPQNKISEFHLKTGQGVLAIRSLYGNHDFFCLPDIQDIPLLIDKTEGLGERMVLDFDHSWMPEQESVAFDVDAILEKLSNLHKESRKGFWGVTTDFARDIKWA